jgi:PPK2 family polyphosphate:nucleotide phosphotransferase
MAFDALRLRPGRSVRLDRFDPADTSAFPGGKRRAEATLDKRRQDLDRLQELFYADGRRALLVVLQGMDTAGKDGTIRHVFEGVNPQGVVVHSFRAPTPAELGHDFLWRAHAATPRRGEIGIFNRSHYEDVLIVRVHGLVPRAVWSQRYSAINAFERNLVREGTTVLKFFLHLGRDEQAKRLRERIDDPTKRWKLTIDDARERRFWPDYTRAYEELLCRTTTRWAPWYIVPSDHKWFRNLVVSTLILETLRGMNLRYPKPAVNLASYQIA